MNRRSQDSGAGAASEQPSSTNQNVPRTRREKPMSDFSAAGYYGYGVFSKEGEFPWAAAITQGDAEVLADALTSSHVLGLRFEVRAL